LKLTSSNSAQVRFSNFVTLNRQHKSNQASPRWVTHVASAISLSIFGVGYVCLMVFVTGCSDEETAHVDGAFPKRPIKVVVPFGAGGGSDTHARIIQQAIKEHSLLDEPLVIINRGGAGGTIGSRYFKSANPDGYTIMLLHKAVLTAKYGGKVKYGPEAFDIIAGTGVDSEVITVSADSPYKTIDDLLNAAAQPDSNVTFAVNIGAPSHFTALRLEQLRKGARFAFVQTGGGAKRVTAINSGLAKVSIFAVGEYVRFNEVDEPDTPPLRALAVLSKARKPVIAKVPTAIEQGYDLLGSNTQYWWAPKGTPADRIAIISEAIKKAVATPDVQEKLSANQMDPVFFSGEQVLKGLTDAEPSIARVSSQPRGDLPDFAQAVAVMCSLLGVGVVISVLNQRKKVRPELASDSSGGKNPSDITEGDDQAQLADAVETDQPSVALASFFSLAVAVYVLLLQWSVDFRAATIGFVLLTGMCLWGRKRHQLITLILAGLIVGVGTYYLLTQVMVVDLP
jgi:putative tricarboxylic transport membrane protein